MKKLILSSLIVTMLFFGGTANAGITTGGLAFLAAVEAGVYAPSVVALAAFVFTGGAVGGAVGLGSKFLIEKIPPVEEQLKSVTETRKTVYNVIWYTIILACFVYLDEDHQVVEFGSIDPSNASEHGLTKKDATVYNEELAEINLAFDEFSKRYNNEMTQEEATTAYNEVATDVGLSSGARSVLSKVFVHALEK